jgi:hypothetical protein
MEFKELEWEKLKEGVYISCNTPIRFVITKEQQKDGNSFPYYSFSNSLKIAHDRVAVGVESAKEAASRIFKEHIEGLIIKDK